MFSNYQVHAFHEDIYDKFLVTYSKEKSKKAVMYTDTSREILYMIEDELNCYGTTILDELHNQHNDYSTPLNEVSIDDQRNILLKLEKQRKRRIT